MPIDPQLQEILDEYKSFTPPPLTSLSPEAARNLPFLKNAVEEMLGERLRTRLTTLARPYPEPVPRIRHVTMPGPGGQILARLYIPEDGAPFPVLVYFHGGGFVIAGLDQYESSCRALANAAGCMVLSVAYRQAPEHKFPAAAEDAYAAVQWAFYNAERYGGDPRRLAVAGESAGGNLATVSCLIAKDRGGIMPAFQLLIYPVVDWVFDKRSHRENAQTIPLSSEMLPWFRRHYLKGRSDQENPYASPLMAKDLSGLPDALVITAEYDPLRDEGEMYAQRLREAGVRAAATRYEGMTHEFFGLSGVVDHAKDAVDEAAHALNEAFERRAASAWG